MRIAETVTFGGSSLDRAAELRGDDVALEAAKANGLADVVVFWRGKPLLCGEECGQLTRLAPQHPLFDELEEAPLLLGREEDGRLVFVHDFSSWAPEAFDAAAMGTFLDPTEQQHPDLPEDHVFVELRGCLTRLNPRDAELAATARSVLEWHRSHRFCSSCGQESELAMAGWQRTCPSCGAHHFPRTDPVVIMLITNDNNVLMGRSHGWPDGMYSLLAGFVEPGETIEAAVRREVFEEAGIRVSDVRYLASQPWAFPSSLMFGCAGVAINNEIRIEPIEIDDARWFSREELVDAFAGEHPLLKPARKGAIAHFLLWNWLADRLD